MRPAKSPSNSCSKTMLQAAGLKTKGHAMLFQYHPPAAPDFLRRNEVLYEISL
jgi:hypothetical protein